MLTEKVEFCLCVLVVGGELYIAMQLYDCTVRLIAPWRHSWVLQNLQWTDRQESELIIQFNIALSSNPELCLEFQVSSSTGS